MLLISVVVGSDENIVMNEWQIYLSPIYLSPIGEDGSLAL